MRTCIRLVVSFFIVATLFPLFKVSKADEQTATLSRKNDLPAWEAWEIPRRGISFLFGLGGGLLGLYAFKSSQAKGWAVASRDIFLGGVTAAILITKTPDAGEILSHSLAMGAMWQTVLQATFQAAVKGEVPNV